MHFLSSLIKTTLPNYLSSLPIPDTIGGWFKLGFRDWISLVPPTAAVAGITYMAYRAFCPKARPPCDGLVNLSVLKNNPKVVDNIDIEDIAEKVVLCRCWRSKNWPYCDGSHGTHNASTNDNVGPAVIKHKAK